MGDLAELAKYIGGAGVGGGFVIGVIFAVKYLRNGRTAEATDTRGPLPPVKVTPCPSEPVLQQYKENALVLSEVHKGLVEAVQRNTSAAERQTAAMIEHNAHLQDQNTSLARLAELWGRRD
jgi:hypothetical protein